MTEQKSSLPALDNRLKELVEQDKQKEKELYLRVQGFAKILNDEVEADKLEEHPFVSGARYLPISFKEAMLDSIFFGLWETKNFRWERILNEIVASIELSVFHPVFKQWLTRTGVAAINIKTDKLPDEIKKKMEQPDINGWYIDPMNKKPMALTMGGFATLKAMCFRNACLSVGKRFGRDVNRNQVSDYEKFLKSDKSKILELREKLSELISQIQDGEEKQKTINLILETEAAGKADVEFYEQQIKYYEKGS